MVDGDFGTLLDKIDESGIRDNMIVIFVGDDGRDTTFHAQNNRNASGPMRGGYLSTYEDHQHKKN
jgi:arylsulfatase